MGTPFDGKFSKNLLGQPKKKMCPCSITTEINCFGTNNIEEA